MLRQRLLPHLLQGHSPIHQRSASVAPLPKLESVQSVSINGAHCLSKRGTDLRCVAAPPSIVSTPPCAVFPQTPALHLQGGSGGLMRSDQRRALAHHLETCHPDPGERVVADLQGGNGGRMRDSGAPSTITSRPATLILLRGWLRTCRVAVAASCAADSGAPSTITSRPATLILLRGWLRTCRAAVAAACGQRRALDHHLKA